MPLVRKGTNPVVEEQKNHFLRLLLQWINVFLRYPWTAVSLTFHIPGDCLGFARVQGFLLSQ